MKLSASIQFLLLSYIVVSVNSYNGTIFNPLESIIGAHRPKQIESTLSETTTIGKQYSPVYIARQDGLRINNKIESLPGQPDGVSFDQYSGYVTVDPKAGRHLFYYFTESHNSSSKPLVLWLNGGPGCSSLAGGAMSELGPFRVNKDGATLSHNKYAWNKEANVIFLESPAGVGFSYSETRSDYNKSGDIRTAADSYTFLVNWLERFPEYKTRDFFITGESYAGHYVPQLAQLILRNNKITNQTVINLKGIAIGNPVIDDETQISGTVDYLWSHAILSDESYEGIALKCNFSSNKPLSKDCVSFMNGIDIGNIYGYDIYAPICNTSFSKIGPAHALDPCIDDYIYSYMNNPKVQKSLHANVTGTIPGPWQKCSSNVGSHWNDSPSTVLPVIKELISSGISVWIYSGDTDRCIAVTTSRYAIKKLQAKVKTPWYPWYLQGEVGGYVVGYENLTFATIRGAGHFVPGYQPARALTFFSSFLSGKLPPRTKK